MRVLSLLCLAAAACAPVAGEPVAGPASGGEAALFVANKFGNSLSKIDLASGEEVARVDSCADPHELATSPDGTHVALACYGGTSVDLFRASDLSRVKRIELGENARPHGIVWHANGDLYTTAEGRRSIFWIRDPLSENAETFEFSTGQEGTHMLAVAPDARHAWTVDMGSKTVTLVDLLTRRAPRSVEVGIEPEGIDLAPNGRTLWVSARGSDKAFALDPQTLEVRHEVATGDFPLRLAIRPQGDVAVTSNLADGSLTVIDLATARAVRTIPVSGREEAEARQQVTIVWSDDGERIYVAETGSDTIAEVDFASGTVLRRLATGDGGDGLAIVG
ncbi:beta-propeller fold lactonase family protein [Pelagerythrobacter rhizovicinus]|uniref:YncE family protein n=1 Tax=Pelagerythrobacter rhizovicinus TaxID=2268576 RepID=A0A4Q2KI24_9SPHN|nr:beta-propeller fold lactonase family protein [Pelagerythrobacter rhizovicinus]RXZ63917.1 YncE family protein [Pelagerythrobacter rhizovicinus]